MNKSFVALPYVGEVLFDWFQPMTFTKVLKTVEQFKKNDTPVVFGFIGVLQAFSPTQLRIKPEGQRTWQWFMVHATPDLILKTDDIIAYLGVQYRVMEKIDYVAYGYVEYHVVQDFTGSGPNT